MSRKEFRTLVSLEDARKALEPFYRRSVESVPLGECYDRTLAEDVYSKVDVPGFDRASMDGYAVKAADTWGADEEAPKALRLAGMIHAGDKPAIAVKEGTAVEVATGAVMPAGANAVVMVENTDLHDDMVNVRKPVTPGENVMHTGADVMMGELVLREGTTLTSREVSVLAAVGLDRVRVYKKPVVAIMSTGNELAPPGTRLEPGQIYDVNAYAVGAGVSENGGVPLYLGIVRDTPEAFRDSVLAAIKKADVVITSGSTSAGASDMMFSTVGSVGRVLVHGIKIKPGKPTIIGEAEGKPFIGLPGYPSSALTIFNEVVAPMIRHISGRRGRAIKEVPARMALRVSAEGGREVLLPVGLLKAPEGMSAYPVEKGSGAVSALLDADGYVEIGEDVHVLEEGEPVKVRLLSDEIAFPDLLIIGSHCLGIDVIARMMAARGFTIRSINTGSAGGLRAIRKGIADVAGIHLLDESGTYNESFVRDLPDAVLVKGYIREQGLIVAKGNPMSIKGIADLPGKRFINRTKGSGTRTLLDLELKKLAAERHTTLKALAGTIPGYDIEAKTHSAVASAILTGKADVGLGIKTVADQNGLGFIPLRDEEYDFAVQKARMDKPAIKAFLDVLGSREFKKDIEGLGYRPRP
ncbi:putative molybdopterin biosynthesis protein [Methanocella paludicola SANAE]|uniref:molybdopterin molybdotransferase n=1 Tax=Methanocella paludicola (strain DSM 17711 / JCM 13418 / NBRC 101707 / SANAE) TaxID=304371 RepID=D1Z2E9_METPS|nr:molybdopterin biosynthesis protein [Methanocella paludicola]BAI62871.1 putative molybdopterin biosynthesis protein [Methanocella paludicola SANAE]